MATHKVSIVYDDADGSLKITQRCTTMLGGHSVSHAEEIKLTSADALIRDLKDLMDVNKDALEAKTVELAAQHVAAIGSRVKKGVQLVNLGGSVGISGASKVGAS